MAASENSEIVLFDVQCNRNVCFSPNVWRTRLLLNYKSIAYTTTFLEFPDIAPTLKELGVSPNSVGSPYTLPVIQYRPTGEYVMDSAKIAEFIAEKYPDPPLDIHPPERAKLESLSLHAFVPFLFEIIVPREPTILTPRGREYFVDMMERRFGKPLGDVSPERDEEAWKAADQGLREFFSALHAKSGPFIEGEKVSYIDFWYTAILQTTKTIDEGIFEQICDFDPGSKTTYTACSPWLERQKS